MYVSALPVVSALVLEAYTTPPEVNEVSPVPPFVVARVPASVTAPVVAVLGVKPVEPALKDATVPAVVAKVPLVGSVTFVAPVVVSVRALAPDVASVEPLASVNVPVVLLTVRPLREVAVAAPRTGVTSVGEVAKTAEPVPVSSVKAPARLAELNEPKEVALPTLVTAPVRFALVVTLPAVKPAAVPVMFVPTRADGVPSAGVTSVGEVDITTLPVPVMALDTKFFEASVNTA